MPLNTIDAKKGRTELMVAVLSHDIEALKMVLKQGNLFDVDGDGRTALFYAAERGDEEIVWFLLASLPGTGLGCRWGALLEIRANDGKLAEDWAQINGKTEIKKILSAERQRIDYFE